MNAGWPAVKAAQNAAGPQGDPAVKGSQEIAPDNKSMKENGQTKAALQPEQQTKAIFAVDEDNRVVIRVLDESGKVLMQMPPEQYGFVGKELQDLMKNLFSKEA